MNIKDWRKKTIQHIVRVQKLLSCVINEIVVRSIAHDKTKLISPEADYFAPFTARLFSVTYNSEEYKEMLQQLEPALKHHYSANRHHPEHYGDKNPCSKMTLMDLLEMVCDWKAATERHKDGNINSSIEHNQARFGYSDELKQILYNTVRYLELMEKELNEKVHK